MKLPVFTIRKYTNPFVSLKEPLYPGQDSGNTICCTLGRSSITWHVDGRKPEMPEETHGDTGVNRSEARNRTNLRNDKNAKKKKKKTSGGQ